MPESSKLRRALEVVGIARSISPAAPPLTVEIIRRSASRLGLDLHVLDPEYGYLVELVREGDGQSWPAARRPVVDQLGSCRATLHRQVFQQPAAF